MRILLVADLHYSLPKFDWVVQVAPAYDHAQITGIAAAHLLYEALSTWAPQG